MQKLVWEEKFLFFIHVSSFNIMIQQQTILNVSDNSGARTVKCIKILNGFKRKFAYLGDVIVVSIKQLRNKSKNTSKVQKGEVYKALIIRTKKKKIKKDGSVIFFQQNSVSLLNKQKKLVGTRIIGPVLNEFKRGKLAKFANISAGLV